VEKVVSRVLSVAKGEVMSLIQQLLVNAGVWLFTSSIGVIIGGYISYFNEKWKNVATREDIEDLTKKIEGVKFLFQRRSRIHERQVEMLGKLYTCLFEVQGYAQCMTSRVIFESGKTEEYPKLFESSVTEAQREFVRGCLLLPVAVEEQINVFFQKISEGLVTLRLAKHPMIPDGQKRTEFWEEAGKIAYQEIPALLKIIKDQARLIIHGQEGA
jgi:hypothetical protein